MNQQPTSQMARSMANAIRMLAVDAVEKAKSGHPGLPLGMADAAGLGVQANQFTHAQAAGIHQFHHGTVAQVQPFGFGALLPGCDPVPFGDAAALERELRRGDVYFVGAGHALEVQASADATAWLAACNGMAFA